MHASSHHLSPHSSDPLWGLHWDGCMASAVVVGQVFTVNMKACTMRSHTCQNLNPVFFHALGLNEQVHSLCTYMCKLSSRSSLIRAPPRHVLNPAVLLPVLVLPPIARPFLRPISSHELNGQHMRGRIWTGCRKLHSYSLRTLSCSPRLPLPPSLPPPLPPISPIPAISPPFPHPPHPARSPTPTAPALLSLWLSVMDAILQLGFTLPLSPLGR